MIKIEELIDKKVKTKKTKSKLKGNKIIDLTNPVFNRKESNKNLKELGLTNEEIELINLKN